MRVKSINHSTTCNKTINSQDKNTNNHKFDNYASNISFSARKPDAFKNVFKNLFKKISNFKLSEYMTGIKERKEIDKFKNVLKYDKTFPKNKVAQLFENSSLIDIRARKEFYSFSKYNDFLPKGISEDIRIAILSKVDKNNVKLTKKLYDDPYFPKEKIPSILDDKDSVSFNLKENFYNRIRKRYDNPIFNDYEKMKPYMNDLAFLMEQTDKEYLEFAEILWKNPAFSRGSVLKTMHNPDIEDIKAVKEIYKLAEKNQYKWNTIKEPGYHMQEDVRVPAHLVDDFKERNDIIRNFVFYTTKDNLKMAKELCNSDNLTSQLVMKTLKTVEPKGL